MSTPRDYRARLRRLKKELRKRPARNEDFWEFLVGDPSPVALERMKRSAQWLLAWLRHPDRKLDKKSGKARGDAEVKRAAVSALSVCRVRGSPPPEELQELFAHLLQVDNKPRDEPRNRAKFIRAAEYVAAHPDASDREVARAAGTGHSIVKVWRGNPEFKKFVELDRHLAESCRRREVLAARAVPGGGTVRAGEKT